jgi:hypothetical protein
MMAEYQFEVTFGCSEIVDVNANSYEDACEMARERAHAFYPVNPDGYSFEWDNIEVFCITEPDE